LIALNFSAALCDLVIFVCQDSLLS
jgi:hypothetical protein